jgi:hypothetical protein
MGGQPKSDACGEMSRAVRRSAREPTEVIPQNQRRHQHKVRKKIAADPRAQISQNIPKSYVVSRGTPNPLSRSQ